MQDSKVEKRVLVVDDHEEIAEYLRELARLYNLPIEVVSAATEQAAREHFSCGGFAAAFLNNQLLPRLKHINDGQVKINPKDNSGIRLFRAIKNGLFPDVNPESVIGMSTDWEYVEEGERPSDCITSVEGPEVYVEKLRALLTDE